MSGPPQPGPPPGEQGRSSEQGRSGDHAKSGEQGKPGDGRDLWPRDFGRDGVSGLVTLDRAMRSRDVSRPTESDEADAENVLADLLARVEGRPRSEGRPRPDSRSKSPRSGGSGHPSGGSGHPVPHPPPQRGDSESRS